MTQLHVCWSMSRCSTKSGLRISRLYHLAPPRKQGLGLRSLAGLGHHGQKTTFDALLLSSLLTFNFVEQVNRISPSPLHHFFMQLRGHVILAPRLPAGAGAGLPLPRSAISRIAGKPQANSIFFKASPLHGQLQQVDMLGLLWQRKGLWLRHTSSKALAARVAEISGCFFV